MGEGVRILIFGGLGHLGQALLRQGPAGAAAALGRDEADVTDAGSIEAALEKYAPEAVINAAVFQPVDLCETEASRAFAVNAAGPGLLAAACKSRGIRLTHISTDYVFDGAQRVPYCERDCPTPLNVYARSKLAGEYVVLAADDGHRVVRTSSVYGRALPGRETAPFVEYMLQRASNDEPTRVVDDQVVSPTYVEDLAAALWLLADNDAAGLFHLAGSTAASWYDVAEMVFRLAGRPDLLTRTSSAEFGAAAPRPAYTALRSERCDELGIVPLAGFEDGLARHFADAHPELVA